jgi:hypothetical protein
MSIVDRHNRCSLCNRKSTHLSDGIIMADVKAKMCPSCFTTLKNNVAIRGKLLQTTLPEYRQMVQERAQQQAQEQAYKEFVKAREDVRKVLGA